jgi:DNA topoisomerase-2
MDFVKLVTAKKEETYDYLLNLPNRSFTQNKLDILDKDIQSKETKLKTIQGKTPEDIWMEELENLEQKYKPWLRKMTH